MWISVNKQNSLIFVQKNQALESDNDSVGSYENIPNGQIKTNDSAAKSEMPLNTNTPPVIKESPSITSSLGKPDELVTPSTAHDNSITSDPSEATNTISDDATVLIKTAKLNQPKAASPNTSYEDTTPYESNENSKKCAKPKPEQLEVSQIEVYQILGKLIERERETMYAMTSSTLFNCRLNTSDDKSQP